MKTTLAVIMMTALAAAAAEPGEGPPQTGTLKSAGTDTITLAGGLSKTGEIPDRTLKLTRDARVTLDGKPARLEDLRTGQSITYRLDKDRRVTEVAQRTPAKGPAVVSIGGRLKSVAAGKIEVGTTRPLDLAKDVKVKIDGEDAKLEDLKAGEIATCTLGPDHKTVILVEQRSGK
jgi:hypothetical protein